MSDTNSTVGTKTLWRGRLSGKMPDNVRTFISSLKEDARLVEIDIDVVQAHNLMLFQQEIISRDDLVKILDGLEQARTAWKAGRLSLEVDYIDIHPLVESFLMDCYGVEVGGKSHLGKSRNDQVMADVRIYLRNQTLEIMSLVLELTEVMLEKAQQHKETLMPGYTHTQQAQITTVAHYLLSYISAFMRDIQRLNESYARLNLNPLGACALAGTSLDLDRDYTSQLLGFDGLLDNSIDAISNRDFALELAAILATVMANLSRMASDIILWSSYEFTMVELPDELTDISSAMPQKKNPCPLEMLRGKSGTVFGNVVQLLTMVHGTPTGYNKDLQETKPPLWQALDTVRGSTSVMCQVWGNIKIKKERMEQLVRQNQITALDLAELLASKGMAFRKAHFLVGQLVRKASENEFSWLELTAERVVQTAKESLDAEISINQEEINSAIDPVQSVANRDLPGGPAPKQTGVEIDNHSKNLNMFRNQVAGKKEKLEIANQRLQKLVSEFKI